jgi:hypothetical protein
LPVFLMLSRQMAGFFCLGVYSGKVKII